MELPYLERLHYEGEAAVYGDRSRLWGILDSALRAHRTARRQNSVAASLAAARRADAERWRRIARQRENISLQGLDILAGLGFPRLRIPWGDEDEHWLDEDAGPLPGDAAPDAGLLVGDAAPDAWADPAGAGDTGGDGPAGDQNRAGMPQPHDGHDDDVHDGDAWEEDGPAEGHSLADQPPPWWRGDVEDGDSYLGGQAPGPPGARPTAAEPTAAAGEDVPAAPEGDLADAPIGRADQWPEGTAPVGLGLGLGGVDLDPHAQTGDPEVLAPAPDVPARPRWLGPAGGHFAMPIPAWLKYGVLALLTLVEIPIYYKIFGYFNSLDPLLTWSFTLPVAVGMVLAPHLAGKLFRQRHALPVEPMYRHIAVAVMVLWVLGGCLLGFLRQKVLLVPQFDPVTHQPIGLADQLHLSPWTMTFVFTIVLLLSGLIAFILGLAEVHPAVAAYRGAVTVRENAEAAYLSAVRAEAEVTDADPRSEEDLLAEQRQQAEDRQAAVWAEHHAAKAAYLDAIAMEMGQPTLTQAIGAALGGDPPPLPPRLAADGG
jgi:hypothetical protein